MGQALGVEKIEEILGGMKIPSAPAILGELNEIMGHDEPDVGMVADAIGRDVGIAASVLKTVNSAFFGLKAKINSIRQATALLGLLNINNIVTGLALKNSLGEGEGVSPPEFWDSPVNVALVSAMLAQRYGGIQPDEAYLLGLFQNAGEVMMVQRFKDGYLNTLYEAREGGLNQTELENERYGTNHAVVAFFLSKGWGLPEHLCKVIQRHHDASNFLQEEGGAVSLDRTLMAVLKMSEHIDACFWGRKENSEWMRHGDAVLSYLGVSSIEFLDVTDDMVELLLMGQE